MKQLLDTGHLRVSDVSGLLLVSGDRQSLRLRPDTVPFFLRGQGGGGGVLSCLTCLQSFKSNARQAQSRQNLDPKF